MLATDDSSWLGRLPTELIDIISSGNDEAISRAEAEVYRLGLMDERKDSIHRIEGSIRVILGKSSKRDKPLFPCGLWKGSLTF